MSKRKERKALEEDRKAVQAASQLRATVEEHLDWAKTFDGAPPGEVPGCPLRAHAGERIYLSGEGASLIEPRRGAGHWEGRSQAISVHVPGTKSMRYRVGANRGTFVQGEERPTPIDTGTFVITNQRAVFIGAKQTREWAWSKLIGFTHAVDLPWTSIAVSNRQKNSGVLYDTAGEDQLRFMLDLAVARSAGEVDALISQLEAELEALPTPGPMSQTPAPVAIERESEPVAASPVASAIERKSEPVDALPVAPATERETDPAPRVASLAGWYGDPGGRYKVRYWTGTEWTQHVIDAAGSRSVDPLP